MPTTAPTTPTAPPPTVADLEARAQEAIDAAATAAREAATAREVETERQRQLLEAYDRAECAAWDAAPLNRDVEEARQRFHSAVGDDRVWSALVDWQAAQVRRRTLTARASGLSARYGRGEFSTLPDVWPLHFEEIVRVVQQVAEERISAETAVRDARREAAATGQEVSP